MHDPNKLVITNPKLQKQDRVGRSSWYPYYAGYSYRFAHDLLSSVELDGSQIILDPWNGAGTTTAAASDLGLSSRGLDLNPAVLVAAKARLLSKRTFSSIEPLTHEILDKSEEYLPYASRRDDPLRAWFCGATCCKLRSLDWAIQKLLIKIDEPDYISASGVLDSMSDLAAFFYVCLFRTIRHLCTRFLATNPTWVKAPDNRQSRLRPPNGMVASIFAAQSRGMSSTAHLGNGIERTTEADVRLGVASSEALPLPPSSVDFVLSSPPYCTRIDYAIATRLELAVMGYDVAGRDRNLRSQLIGTPLVRGFDSETQTSWGATCLTFVDRIHKHESKASRTYYLKSHLRYFDAMCRSIGQLSKVLKPHGGCALVVQDSYYKDVHNDLPSILAEMATATGLALLRKVDYPHGRSFGGIHPGRQLYRSGKGVVESVLCFRKE